MKKILTALLFFPFTLSAQTITTIAGGGSSGLGDGGQATLCELNYPVGVATDAAENIFIADRDNHRIRKVSNTGIVTTIAGTGTAGFSGDGGPATLAMIKGPYGIAVGATGSVYFSDENACVRKISSTGTITTVAGIGGSGGFSGDGGSATLAQLNGSALIAVDISGNIYIPDVYDHRIRKVNALGMITTIAGDGTPGSGGDGGPATDAQLNQPYGVAVDVSGNVYIADKENNRVRKVSPLGIISTFAGTGTAGFNGDGISATAAQLKEPFSVVTDNAGNVYVGDTYNYRLRRINTTNTIATLAGTGSSGFVGDGGPAGGAEVKGVLGIAVSAAGHLYLCDPGNDRIRRITSPAYVSSANESDRRIIDVFPVPNDGNFIVDVPSVSGEPIKIIITNSTGATVKELTIPEGRTTVQVDVPTGLYILSATVNGESVSRKLTIIR